MLTTLLVGMLLRVAAHLYPVRYCLGDEKWAEKVGGCFREMGWLAWVGLTAHYKYDASMVTQPSPMRILWWLQVATVARHAWRRFFRVLALLASGWGLLAAVLLASLDARWGLLVATSALVIGVGRRAMADTMALAAQAGIIVALLVDAPLWVVTISVVAALLVKESSVLALPAIGLFGVWHGRQWFDVLEAMMLAGAVWWVIQVMALRCEPISTTLRNMRKAPPNDYVTRKAKGGVLRLVFDLLAQNPVLLILAPVALWHNWTLAIVVLLTLVPVKLVPVSIRVAMLADVWLRLAVALVMPTWVLVAVVLCDVWIWWRTWRRGLVAEATPMGMMQVLGLEEP